MDGEGWRQADAVEFDDPKCYQDALKIRDLISSLVGKL